MSMRDPGLYSWAAADGRMILRSLRENAGLSLIALAMRLDDAGQHIDHSHLQKIESGAIKRPAAPTLDAILTDGLHVPYRVRIDVLAAFGYRLRWELPTPREGRFETNLLDHEVSVAIWPSYLIDFGQRLWGWNRLFPRLLGNTPDDPANAGYLGLTILDILLNPDVGTDRQIANTATFTPMIVAWFKVMTREYWQESWFLEFKAKANTWPGFREMWDQAPEGPQAVLTKFSTIPVSIDVPGVPHPMLFRSLHVPDTLDPRFAILHLVPLNVETQAVCAAWVADDASADLIRIQGISPFEVGAL